MRPRPSWRTSRPSTRRTTTEGAPACLRSLVTQADALAAGSQASGEVLLRRVVNGETSRGHHRLDPAPNGVSLCDHLAKSAAFVVLGVDDGRIVSRTIRNRDDGPCGNHKSFVEMLEGCDAVICGGIGQGAFDALSACGIKPDRKSTR